MVRFIDIIRLNQQQKGKKRSRSLQKISIPDAVKKSQEILGRNDFQNIPALEKTFSSPTDTVEKLYESDAALTCSDMKMSGREKLNTYIKSM